MNTIECHICCNEFDECKHRPRILSCGHTFCSICLKSLLKEGGIICPNCQKSHVTDKIENININFLIESILSPGDKDKTIAFDTGYKCNEHYYEQNFFCETHKEWICRDCTVIQHKPCSHSKDCDNENDCQVITKKEKLDKIKSEKIEKLKSISTIYNVDVLKCRVTECESKLNSKLIVRQDLQTRLKVVEEQNDLEIEVLVKKQNSLKDILSNIETNTNLALVAQQEMLRAQGRVAVEESSRNIEKMIKSAQAWTANELTNIRKKENITEVQIALKEFDDVKLKLCETEKNLHDSKVEHESITNQLKLQLKQSEERILSLEHESSTSYLKLQLKKKKERKLELENETEEKDNSEFDYSEYAKKVEDIFNRFMNKNDPACKNSKKEHDNATGLQNNISVVEIRDLYEVKTHLLRHTDVYLKTKKNLKGLTKVSRFGKLDIFSYGTKEYILLEALSKDDESPPGSLTIQCRRLISKLDSVDFVYFDIGKIESTEKEIILVGSPFGRLYIQLTTSPIRRKQMVEICSSIDYETWRFCSFPTVRNKNRPGELVTCKNYRNGKGLFFDKLYEDLEYDNKDHLISDGKVFGYMDDAAGFSIITRHKYNCYTSWPLLGEVVIGLDILKEAVNNHDVSTIGIHSHGVGFPI